MSRSGLPPPRERRVVVFGVVVYFNGYDVLWCFVFG